MLDAVTVILLTVAAVEVTLPGQPASSITWRRWLGNLMLYAATLAMMSLPVLAGLAAQRGGEGLFGRLHLPAMAALPLGFLLLDAFAYFIHRLDHAWAPLWRLHAVHHSDPELDITTNLRQHPIIALLETAAMSALVLLLGVPVLAVVAYRIAETLVQAVAHANIRFPRGVSRVIVTPSFHRLHHSPDRIETDSNYGQVLAVWDHLFGTARAARGLPERFGLGMFNTPGQQDVHALLAQPFRRRVGAARATGR